MNKNKNLQFGAILASLLHIRFSAITLINQRITEGTLK